MTRDAKHNAGLAILRAITGVIFIAHGWQKVFDFGLAGTAQGFAEMGVPLPEIIGPAIALLELLGGIALVVGVLTRPAAALLALDMLGAMLLVHLPAGFFLPQGYEFTLILFGACALLALVGAGDWSVDHAVQRRRG